MYTIDLENLCYTFKIQTTSHEFVKTIDVEEDIKYLIGYQDSEPVYLEKKIYFKIINIPFSTFFIYNSENINEKINSTKIYNHQNFYFLIESENGSFLIDIDYPGFIRHFTKIIENNQNYLVYSADGVVNLCCGITCLKFRSYTRPVTHKLSDELFLIININDIHFEFTLILCDGYPKIIYQDKIVSNLWTGILSENLKKEIIKMVIYKLNKNLYGFLNLPEEDLCSYFNR